MAKKYHLKYGHMTVSKKILEKLKGEITPRGPSNLYLNRDLLKLFKSECKRQGIKPNRVLEEFMSDFVETSKKLK